MTETEDEPSGDCCAKYFQSEVRLEGQTFLSPSSSTPFKFIVNLHFISPW
jgi:hypothetical protein